MTKTLKLLTLCALAGLMAVGCGDDDATTDMDANTPVPDAADGTDAGPDEDTGPEDDAGSAVTLLGRDNPIALGTQIDRMGRPAVSTGTVGTLTFTSDDDADRDALKDEYNAESDPANWVDFIADMQANLALLDGLDGVCGNQLAYDFVADTGYTVLATVLADDRLFVNANSGTCGVYLAVEANVTGIFPNELCGGRTPLDDVMDSTYSVLVAGPGALNLDTTGIPAISDGLTADDVTHSTDAFPFFAAP